jgi:anthranilate/para-aminobenzoate synthase component I
MSTPRASTVDEAPGLSLPDLRRGAEAARADAEPFACLVSALGHPDLGRRSMLGTGLRLEWRSTRETSSSGREGLLGSLRKAAADAFARGAQGVLLMATHEAVAELESVPVHGDWLDLPRVQLWSVGRVQSAAAGPDAAGWGAPSAASAAVPELTLDERSGLDAAWHRAAMEKIREAIAAGRLYQLCLTFPVHIKPPTDPAALFAWLMSRHPVDHGAWIHLPGLEVLSASPERFVALRGRQVTARPMKGTRRLTPETAEAAMRDLAGSVKDRAENVMIADLVRNDLGRVCAPGSVHAEALWQIERYASVAQMTSTITGELRAGLDVFDLFAAAFPPGSMTGAPKLEACRMIHELERGPRGLYGGAIGWIDPSGDASFSVVIRTLQVREARARWDVGGGIVHDSTATAEWAEAQAKLGPLRDLLGRGALDAPMEG